MSEPASRTAPSDPTYLGSDRAAYALTVDEVLLAERIRSQVELKRELAGDPAPQLWGFTAPVGEMESSWDLRFVRYGSHRRVLGRPTVFVRRMLHAGLYPLLERASAFNGASLRTARSLERRLDEQMARLERQEQELVELRTGGLHQSHLRSDDMFSMEDIFRGSEAAITERQRRYVRHFVGQAPVLDIGCGRGEFLDLLRNDGIGAFGVDRDQAMVDHCREKGFDVSRSDGLALLESLPDNSLGGVFAAQVIEHFTSAQVFNLTSLAYTKLQDGGVLVLETLNPRVVLVHLSFYIDFTHVRLYDPEAMRWLLQTRGFDAVSVEFSLPEPTFEMPVSDDNDPPGGESATPSDMGSAIRRLNELLYGNQTYAVVGTKS